MWRRDCGVTPQAVAEFVEEPDFIAQHAKCKTAQSRRIAHWLNRCMQYGKF